MTREELFNNIEKMSISEEDYETIYTLLLNCSPRLFTKIMEELFLGNIFLSDFRSIFNNKNLSNAIKNSIEFQAKLEDKLIKISKMRKLNNMMISMNIDKEIYNNLVIEEKLDYLESFVFDDPIGRELYTTLLTTGKITIDNILLSRNDFIIPITYNDMYLNKHDRNFMLNNKITEDEMKKIKSIVYYAFNRGDNNE